MRFPRLLADTFDPDFWAASAKSLQLPSLPMRHTSLWHNGLEFFAVYCTERMPRRYEDFNVEVLSRELAFRYFTNGSLPRKFADRFP